MRVLVAFLSLFLISCGVAPPVKDPSPPSIDAGHKRVETVVCGRQAVGENGCVFPQGRVSGSLKIYRIYEGEINIVGQGCGVDRSIQYGQDKENEWVEVELADLVGDRLENDCFLSINQFVKFKGAEDVPFPVRGMYGSVVLGTCPAGTSCSISTEQRRAGSAIPAWKPNLPLSGTLMVQGCGVEVLPPANYEGQPSVNLQAMWPNGYPADGKIGCTFIMGVRGSDGSKYKIYRRVWLYKKSAILLPAPAFSGNEFQADASVSLSIVDGKHILKNKGSFKPAAEGNMFRFYTTQGRSLVLKLKGGKVEWTQ